MNSQHAQEILRLYRPVAAGEGDPDIAAALEQVKSDPALERWFVRQQAFDAAVRDGLRQISPPTDLKDRILARHLGVKVIVWWRRPEWLAAAAGIVLLMGLAGFWISPPEHNRLADFRARMAKTALRDYRMDLVTSDLGQIESYLAKQGSPGDYDLSPGLKELSGVGCARLRWHNQPVSMVCFRQGNSALLWLFIIDQAALEDAPATTQPAFVQMGKLATATWSDQGKTFILAGIGDPSLIRKYL